ncbi:MAG: hypothetical protein AB4290_00690 [Spirulina sp.]
MALAIARFHDHQEDKTRFEIDIGMTNRFYAYAIGDDRAFRRNGLTFLENKRFVSPILGPLSPETLGRTLLAVPSDRFDSRYRYLQLFSFRDRHGTGPALSAIVPVPITANSVSFSFSPKTAMYNRRNAPPYNPPPHQIPPDTIPFSYRESYSTSMGFFSGLIKTVGKVAKGVVNAVKTVAPVAAPILTGIFGPGAGVAVKGITSLLDSLVGTGGDKKQLKQQLTNPDTLNQVVGLISQLKNLKANPGTVQAKAMNFADDRTPPGQRMMPQEVFDRMPSLMPLLGRSLHPETVRTISSGPVRERVLIGTISQGALDAGKHFPGFIRAIEDELDGDDHPALLPLRNGRNGLEPPYHRQETVRLSFADIRPQSAGGRSRVLYRIDEDLSFPLMLETPRPITRGTVQILLKHPETLEVLVEKKYRVEDLRSGPIRGSFGLGREQLRSLKPNEDYLICALLTWTARSSRTDNKRRLGTSTSVLATLVGEFFFDRLEGVEETFSLSDPQEYRPYWHKIWQGNLGNNGSRIAFDCKYYYVLEPQRPNHARMETLISVNDDEMGGRSGKLKTGFVFSLDLLEKLLAWISDKPRLQPEEMMALRCCEFRESFNRLARTQVDFTGNGGDSATLWVYPEIEVRRVILKRVVDSDANGRVLALSDRTVYFPIPSTARFVGTQS